MNREFQGHACPPVAARPAGPWAGARGRAATALLRPASLGIGVLLGVLALAWCLLPGPDDRPVPAARAAAARAVVGPVEGPEDGPVEDGLPPAGSNVPYEPILESGNANLSFAHRAGLHRTGNPLRLTASAVLAIDRATGKVLYSRNERAILPIASLTKLLSAIVVLDAKLSMAARLRITRDDVDRLRHSRSRLPVGTVISRAEALRLALMSSENRAAHALARTFPGGVAAFVRAMNRKAAEIGMTGSAFFDATGLTNRNRATAMDVARLAAAAAGHALLRAYTTTRQHRAVFGKRSVQYLNSNRLVRFTRWTILLQKTGYIVESGHCMAMVTRIGRRAVTLVLLDSGSASHSVSDARRLRRWLAVHGGATR